VRFRSSVPASIKQKNGGLEKNFEAAVAFTHHKEACFMA